MKPSPTTEANRAPLRIETDENGTRRLYRGEEFIGVPSLREVELFNSRAALLSACERAVDQCEKLRLTINPLLVELPEKSTVTGEDNFALRLKVLKIQAAAEGQIRLVRAAIAAARKGEA